MAGLNTRLAKLRRQADVVVNAPGRAEIIGNHTDYNLGYALGCAISPSTLGLFKKRLDKKIILTTTLPGLNDQVVEFTLDKIVRDEKIKWGNYARGVVNELLKLNYPLSGAEILVDTNFSISGGLSSSAALELCLAYGLLALVKQPIDPETIAHACQRAENSNLVMSPCGFLDQAVITFAQKDKMVFLDFTPPVKTKLIPADLSSSGTSFVVVVDKTVKRVLGESGYPARRKMCESACKTLKISSLRQLSISDFESKKNRLGPIVSQRVKHIVYENQRVLDAVTALENNDVVKFGRLLNQSGKSALDLYGLDENTPELRYLMESAQKLEGVLGARNMGGGFSAIILALVKNEIMPQFPANLQKKYQEKFPGCLEFVQFNPSPGVRLLL
jgi:galactokinase